MNIIDKIQSRKAILPKGWVKFINANIVVATLKNTHINRKGSIIMLACVEPFDFT